jgi:serine/threonine protein kinase
VRPHTTLRLLSLASVRLLLCLASDLLRGLVGRHAQYGSLKQLLEKFGKLSEKLVASCVIQVLEGLDYLHHNGTMHSNLKTTNILITQSGDVKLSDFGISHNLNVIKHRGKRFPWVPNWSAPEAIRSMRASKESDIWSLGCTVIELLTGDQPYGDMIDPVSGTDPLCARIASVSLKYYNLFCSNDLDN